jgi:hypothetical protein
MAFDYLSGGSIDLFRLIFQEILKISPTLLYKYTTVQEQVFKLILLPHVILFIFLFGFGMFVIPENKGLRYLVMIVAYIFVVIQGWYGTFLVPLLEVWFWLMLVFGLFLFFISRIIHPAAAKELGKAAGLVAQDIGKKMGKEKQIEKLAKELEHIEKQKQKYLPHIDDNPGAAQVYAQLEQREFEIKRKIEKLEG